MTSSPHQPLSAPLQHNIVLNVRRLPTYGHGSRSSQWWGIMGFCAAEGIGFVLAFGAYFYLVFVNGAWPLSSEPPDIYTSTFHTALMLASLWPNFLARKYSEREDLSKVRRYLLIMSVLGVALLGLRAFEIALLHTKWDHNAYGSIVWLLIGFHTLHLLTDVVDTIVLTVLMFTRHGHGRRFNNIGQNCDYWTFVVAAWVPLYVIVYLFPRW
jgi:heme/copper-type cytochrome/quinol oxidase subunit 3